MLREMQRLTETTSGNNQRKIDESTAVQIQGHSVW